MSVTTTDEFPQFVNLNMKTGEFTSLTDGVKLPSETENEPTVLDFFKDLFKKIVDFILRFLNLDLVR